VGNLYRRRIRAFFVYLDQYIRLLFNPAVKRPLAVLWGYTKLCWLARFQPERTKPLKLLNFEVSYGRLFLSTFGILGGGGC